MSKNSMEKTKMKIETKRQRLFDFITTWESAVFTEKEHKDRFYTYLGLIIQSRLMSDFVHLNSEDYPAYGILGDIPLYEHMNDYDIDEIYNKCLKKTNE
jgi:hypothetical protein